MLLKICFNLVTRKLIVNAKNNQYYTWVLLGINRLTACATKYGIFFYSLWIARSTHDSVGVLVEQNGLCKTFNRNNIKKDDILEKRAATLDITFSCFLLGFSCCLMVHECCLWTCLCGTAASCSHYSGYYNLKVNLLSSPKLKMAKLLTPILNFQRTL